MEVLSSVAGVVKELKVKVGDTLSEGGVVAVIETQEAADASAAADVDDAEKQKAPLPPAGEGGAQGAPGEGAASKAEPSPQPSRVNGSGGKSEAPAPEPAAATGRKPDIQCAVVVHGAGPGGYPAASRATNPGLATGLFAR